MEIEKIEDQFALVGLSGDEVASLQSMMVHYAENVNDKEVARKWRHLLIKIDKILKS